MRRGLALALLAACSSSPATPTRIAAAIVPAATSTQLDVLFMVDDSTNTLDYRNALAAAFEPFAHRLALRAPIDLHVGVVSSDLGTSGANGAPPAPGIGSGPGMCAGAGKNGDLQNHGTTVTDAYLIDGPNGSNYTGSLGSAFETLVDTPTETCGFEQHLEAVKRALTASATNTGFLRASAPLAIVLVGDEDDCSIEDPTFFSGDTATLGPLQSFRCTQFGITCDEGGATPDAMAQPGAKSLCHGSSDSTYLTHTADYETFLAGLKTDPRNLMIGAIVGDPTPFAVELRAPIGSTTQIPALAHSCSYSQAGSTHDADPCVRDVELASTFDRHAITSICNTDLGGPLTTIAREIDSMMGSPCLTRDIALPANCIATDDVGALAAFTIVEDDAMCPDGQHLRVQLAGTPTGSVTVRCTPP